MLNILGDLYNDEPYNNKLNDIFNICKGNSDRLTWILKWFRLWVLYNNHDEKYSMLRNKDFKHLDEHDISDSLSRFGRHGFSTILTHFLSLPIDEIKNYQYGNKSLEGVMNDFSTIEGKWKTSNDQRVSLQGDEDIVMSFPNGFVWMNLNRAGCQDEARAMGHCGNGVGRDGETILSLRKKISNNVYRPVTTFILDKNGMLGEMKGRENDKPSEKYHSYIVALLKHDIIKGIKGGGYKPENNFSLIDLNDNKVRDELLDTKPELHDLSTLYYRYKKSPEEKYKKALEDAIYNEISGVHDVNIDKHHIDIFLTAGKNAEDFLKEFYINLPEIYDNDRDMILKYSKERFEFDDNEAINFTNDTMEFMNSVLESMINNINLKWSAVYIYHDNKKDEYQLMLNLDDWINDEYSNRETFESSYGNSFDELDDYQDYYQDMTDEEEKFLEMRDEDSEFDYLYELWLGNYSKETNDDQMEFGF